MLLAILLTVSGFFLPLHQSSAYALIDLNTLSADSSLAEEVGEDIEVKNSGIEKVEVEHKQKGLLLALWPITFTVKVVVLPDGTVDLHYPWYSAITVDRQEEIETKVKVAVSTALKEKLVGSVRAEGTPTGFTTEEAELVKKTVEESLSLSLTTQE